ncbi:hypothetical protein CRE_01354 [Caenorhabditis remanei]|uniref:Uncharacterized protein n=1 Tax=Caenorhabditis remanei TaxID=31234 RepID=E3NDA7_CAERE|nr:hypothetical protein CRE_01354 [Caenorhabditis remanei]
MALTSSRYSVLAKAELSRLGVDLYTARFEMKCIDYAGFRRLIVRFPFSDLRDTVPVELVLRHLVEIVTRTTWSLNGDESKSGQIHIPSTYFFRHEVTFSGDYIRISARVRQVYGQTFQLQTTVRLQDSTLVGAGHTTIFVSHMVPEADDPNTSEESKKSSQETSASLRIKSSKTVDKCGSARHVKPSAPTLDYLPSDGEDVDPEHVERCYAFFNSENEEKQREVGENDEDGAENSLKTPSEHTNRVVPESSLADGYGISSSLKKISEIPTGPVLLTTGFQSVPSSIGKRKQAETSVPVEKRPKQMLSSRNFVLINFTTRSASYQNELKVMLRGMGIHTARISNIQKLPIASENRHIAHFHVDSKEEVELMNEQIRSSEWQTLFGEIEKIDSTSFCWHDIDVKGVLKRMLISKEFALFKKRPCSSLYKLLQNRKQMKSVVNNHILLAHMSQALTGPGKDLLAEIREEVNKNR